MIEEGIFYRQLYKGRQLVVGVVPCHVQLLSRGQNYGPKARTVFVKHVLL